MKYLTAAVFLTTISTLFLTMPAPSPAIDRGGCLTCHRYPGLVKYEKPDTFKVLHIDEEKQLASSHGTTDCRECHPKTVKIPHTNVTDVECNKTCHVEDRGKIEKIEASYLKDFHKNERFAITRIDDKTSCRVCHPLYPHSQHNKVRAYLNIHTGYTLCEVCHMKKEGLQDMSYDWKEPEEFEFTGQAYGTHEEREEEEARHPENMVDKMLRIIQRNRDGTDQVQKKVYVISRIAVYHSEGGKKSLFINTRDNDRARDFLEKEASLNTAERNKELDFFHRDIAKKEISVACDECHSPQGMLDFRKLGFHENRAKDLEYLNIKGLVKKYETFYLPNLFTPPR
ncbi:MAG: hypothetical protein JSU90_09425 [Nitrospiraceae bacterium]|nr:MAG: hypothetical protein JSU90_09425 [Nitrospiraceae bacterium]